MIATVDKNTCTGCGLCVDTCPEVFEIEGDFAIVKTNPVPPPSEKECQEAADGCPVNAISIKK